MKHAVIFHVVCAHSALKVTEAHLLLSSVLNVRDGELGFGE